MPPIFDVPATSTRLFYEDKKNLKPLGHPDIEDHRRNLNERVNSMKTR